MNKSAGEKQGTLYMVATPIGNLEDITLRALRVLKEVDLIAAEDTRHSRILLNAYNIKTPLISLHEHNEKERSALIVSRIQGGMSVAYVSDAGTPCISDPGYHLVHFALENKISVIPVPGPSALIAALSVCGFPADHFLFCGFLPPKENKRRRFLESIQDEEKTIVFYESPSRITAMLKDVYDVLGDRQIVVARELTKVFEEIKRGRISDILSQVPVGKTKGEFTVIIQGASPEPVSFRDDEIQEILLRLWAQSPISLRDAVADAVRTTGLPRKKVYDIAVKIRPVPDRN
jgi:16S rRNA (cytidine1402-2'-O)-methyltransferase